MSSSLLDNLPPRPPTPPRETHNEATAVQCQVLTAASIDGQPTVQTPPGINSPSSAENSTSRRRKKVGFSAKAEYQEPPIYPDGLTRRHAHPTPVSLPRSASKPVKSILKVTNYIPSPLELANGDSTDPTTPVLDLATMLESSIQMLAGGERHAKVDAYTMLPRALRASNNLPDRVALQDKMGLLMQFIQRDITSKTPDGNLDSSVVKHALVFLKTLHYFPSIYSKITNDFAVFIVDHCIRSFEDPSVPKDIVRHLMQVMIIQNFSSKVLTADRVGRLVTSLRHIEEHLQGKSIVMSRVLIYQKLVKQARPMMVIHSDWLFDLFTDMLSTVKDIRSAAIGLGFDAAFRIGHEKQLSRKVMEVFRVTLDDQRYIEYYEEKLKAMNQEKHESAAVPQIWSVVILLLRVRLGEWDRMHIWLAIIERCFNSPSPTARVEANHAWNRLVYLMQSPDDVPLVKNLSTLTSPLLMQLKRKGPDELRRAVFSSICYLIYYTFKPNTNPTLLDQYWDISIKPVISKLINPNFEPSREYLDHACAILSGLFDCTTARLWKANRVENSSERDVLKPEMKPEELPAIDSKWIRRNASKVFATVQPVLARDFLGLADRKSGTFRLWESLVGTVASAASKEIKVSKDTSVFVTEAFKVLQGVWKQGIAVDENAQPVADKFLAAVRAYVEVMVSSLGLLPFTEKPGKTQALVKAPVHQLFSMLSALPPGIPDDSDFAQFLVLVFAPFFGSKGDKAKMDLAQDMLQTIPMEAPRPYGPWLLVAGTILTWLEPTSSSHQSTGSGSENIVGHDYRDIVKVLERGIRSTPNLPWDHWEPLFHALYERARDETGDAGVAIVAIEPLAKVALDQLTQRATAVPPANTLRCVVTLMGFATHPRDRQAVDSARRRLWGTVLAGPRSSGFDTFDNFYKAVNEALVYLYDEIDSAGSDAAVPLLKELCGFFDRCNRQLFLKALFALQDGFLPWLQDAKRLLGSQSSEAFSMVKSLWDKLSSLLSDIEKLDAQLESLERLFCATFGSSHRSIVSSSVSLWNRLFEHAEHLDYPKKLKAALVQVQPHADIILPGLDVSSAEYAGQQPPFVESLDDYSLPKMPYTRSSRRGTPLRTVSAHSESPMSAKRGAATRHGLFDTTLTAKSTRVTRQNAAPRLRHDDSQLQFAAIEPSPVTGQEVESQVLTERQREVRERQKETTALFPEIRSSPGPKSKQPTHVLPARMSSPGKGHNSQVRIAITPEPDGGYDDFVSSTPTPRRGEPIHISDHDMMEPPSSPPEPIGNPLAAEIRSRSASNSLLDDWQFSSSPISGSPNPDRQATIPDSSGQSDDITMSDADEELPHSQYDAGMATGDEPEPATENEIIEESVIIEPPKLSPTIVKLDPIGPHTPSKNLRSAQRQETPKSDSDVFVDAPTSPMEITPRRTERVTRSAARSSSVPDSQPRPLVNTSFENISDVDERSLLRLAVELDAGMLHPTEYNRTTALPEKKEGVTEKVPSPRPFDCIVVVGEGDSPAKRPTSSQGSPRKTRSSSSMSSSVDAEQTSSSQSQSKGRGGRGKRKRALSKTHETGTGGKKRKHDSSSGSEPAEVPDSQLGSQVPEAIADDGGVTIPSSLPEFPSQGSFGGSESSQSVSSMLAAEDHHLGDEGDAHMGEEDDQDVQSQIALESQQSLSQQDRMGEESPTRLFTPSGSQAGKSNDDESGDNQLEDVKVEVTHQEEDSKMGEAEVEVVNNNNKIVNDKEVVLEGEQQEAEAVQPRQEKPHQVLKPVQKIMGILRNGLDMLRSASLSRQEVYQIEDMFMDMKKELYMAESRGRSRSSSAGGEGEEEGERA